MTPPEEAVAPLDAYATAKPDEPTFTLQGGDPLAAHLVRAWAALARIRAGVMGATGLAAGDILGDCAIAAGDAVEHDEREQENLLIRATAAEEVSWQMDAYLKGQPFKAETEVVVDDTPEELARIDLHDYRVRAAQKINNMVADLQDMIDDLAPRWNDRPESTETMLRQAKAHLELISHWVEPRRLMKKEPIHHG